MQCDCFGFLLRGLDSMLSDVRWAVLKFHQLEGEKDMMTTADMTVYSLLVLNISLFRSRHAGDFAGSSHISVTSSSEWCQKMSGKLLFYFV